MFLLKAGPLEHLKKSALITVTRVSTGLEQKVENSVDLMENTGFKSKSLENKFCFRVGLKGFFLLFTNAACQYIFI